MGRLTPRWSITGRRRSGARCASGASQAVRAEDAATGRASAGGVPGGGTAAARAGRRGRRTGPRDGLPRQVSLAAERPAEELAAGGGVERREVVASEDDA